MSDDQERPLTGARARRHSRYTRPRRYVSWAWLIAGLIIGIGGGVYFAWEVAPVEEFDTVPRQLRMEDRAEYLVAIMLNHNYENNLDETIQRLVELNLPGDDPIQQVAEIACDLASTGYASNTSGLRALRILIDFYQSQSRTGCADELIPINSTPVPSVVEITVPTPTIAPPATKTPTPPGTFAPTPTAPRVVIPTSVNTRRFEGFFRNTFCSVELSGMIEVRVIDPNGTPIPGQPIRVRWDSGESIFFTGLKPERGDDFADFQMESGRQYVIDMPGLANPLNTTLTASECFTAAGDRALTSYEIVFREG